MSAALHLSDLRVSFPIRRGLLRRRTGQTIAVGGVSIDVPAGACVGLVGESGCGKTTVGRAVLRLLPQEAEVTGRIEIAGADVTSARAGALRRIRRSAQMIFQDPGGSLNPRHRVGEIVAEPLLVHRLCDTASQRRDRAADMLQRCGLPPASMDRWPHEFSGGQRQRIAIARALVCGPGLLICDEPTSALDVSIQAQILNLLCDLRRDLNLSMLFISHDLAVVRHMCSDIAVMRQGRIIERGPAPAVIDRPEHPYTRALVAAVPQARPQAAPTA
ncbi:MAG: ABC transporter ATP-binding protein [Phycisphaeraceae bacterium]|nr:ABC transporter ATP-binding protein [Phycisphaeraceae bacterium]